MPEDEYYEIIKNQPCCDEVNCGSSDAMWVYYPVGKPTNAFCYSCNTFFNADVLFENGYDTDEDADGSPYALVDRPIISKQADMISDDKIDHILKTSTMDGQNFRGITNETLDYYKIRTEYEGGVVSRRYYPNTIDYIPSSYQVRVVKVKDFFFIGRAGNKTQFFGQRLYKDGGKRLLIVGGQEDCAAAQQMLWNYAKTKGKTEYGRPCVVSVPSGEGCVAIIKEQFEWLEQFEEIYFGLDNDEAGLKAMEDALPHFPAGKVRVVKWASKDPNAMLEGGKSTQFLSNYFDAKPFVPVGIEDSTKLSGDLRETLLVEKMPLPKFMKVLQSMMGGGIPPKKIINIASETGIGKTTLVNELIYELIFNPNCLPCVVTLELDMPEYGMTMLSRHLGRKLINIPSGKDAVAWLDQPENLEKEHELFYNEDGSPRFFLVDDRSGTIASIQKKVEELVVRFGCNVVVFDPLTDLIASQPLDVQENFMSWQKQMKKAHDVTFLNVLHVRDAPSSNEQTQDSVRFLKEGDIHGSSSQAKSADANIFISRNKYSDDPRVKNTTEVWCPKIRWTGNTGRAGKWFYCNVTHKMWDYEEYMAKHYTNGVPNA